MELIIHRGTHQIGGCATEIKTGKARIFIDFGSELDNATPSELHIFGLTHGVSDCDGVFFTHYHGDHVGMMDSINTDIPLYIGKLSKQILILSNSRQKNYSDEHLQQLKTFEAGKSVLLKDIKITPFTVDHSAFDSYMFLIEAEGKRILHTGDFRAHGFRGKGLHKVLEYYIGKVDTLICEGTVLNRNTQSSMTEHELSKKAESLLNDNKYVFVVCASTNIDRLAAFCSAVPKGKYCICDEYQKSVLELVEKNAGSFSPLYRFPKVLSYGKNLDDKMERFGFCMFVRLGNPVHKAVMERYRESNPLVIYSMWQGYLQNEKTATFLENFRVENLHTSGHADFSALSMLIEETSPKQIIPIHTEAPEELRKICCNSDVISVKDEEVIIL